MKFVLADRFSAGISRRPWLTRLVFRIEAGVMHLLWWTLKLLGPDVSSRLGSWLLRTFGPRNGDKARLVRQQLARIAPEADAATLADLEARSWDNLGAVFGEYPNLERIGAGERLELVDEADLGAYARRERSAVFFGAHYANWELLALALARAGVPMVALYAPVQNPHLDALMSRARLQLGCGTHARGDSIRPLLKHLRGGGSLGSLVDLRTTDGSPLPLFGHDTLLPTTAARLALGTGSDLVPMVAARTGRARYRVTAGPALDLSDVVASDLDSEAAALELTRRMLGLVEDWIRAEPSLWLLANRRWDKHDLNAASADARARPAT